ncbi:hypothetical protein F4802DRAFT_316205 [Xylaria palmicola]|nr:hypothetical protein F4802DRAFT_316205 [Xylaria palmicola]
MRFSNNGAVAMAMAASVATANPHNGLLGLGDPYNGPGLGKPIHADIDLNADLSGKVLVAGVLADVAVDPIAEVKAAAKVAVVCEECHVRGNIDASISLEKVVPALSLSIKDVDILLDLDVYIGAAATIAVNLVTAAKVSLPLPGLDVEALVYLDLILGVHTELDVSAGVYVSLPEASLETDILSGDILDVDFSGVAVKVLPIKVRIGCTELLADLRLRVDLAVAAAVDVDDALPLDELLGLHLPSIGAGLELSVFANLLEYVGLFCTAPECPLAEESYGLNVGAAVELDVEVKDLLSIHLAPTVATALLSIPTNTICIPSFTATPPASTGAPTASGSGSSVVLPTSSTPGAEPTYSGLPSTSSGAATYSGAVTTPTPSGYGWVTSTVTDTATYTITACAVNVPNCPAGYQTSVTLVHTTSYTSVCSGTATGEVSAAPVPTSTRHNIETITKHVTTMVPCDSTSTFVPPTSISAVPYPSDIPTHATSYPAGSASPSSTAGGYPGSVPAGYPTPSYPAGSSATPYPAGSSSVSYPAGGSTASYPVGGASPSYPAGGASPSYPAGGASPSYPAGGASASYPAGASTPSYPAGGVSPSYPAGASPSYPAGGSTPYPTGASPSYPVGGSPGGYPVGGASGAGYPTPVPYPSAPVPPSGGNSSVPQTWATYQPSTTAAAGYPTAPAGTPPATAGAGKVGSSIAAVVALMGAVMAL